MNKISFFLSCNLQELNNGIEVEENKNFQNTFNFISKESGFGEKEKKQLHLYL